jgi:hypothetical protein
VRAAENFSLFLRCECVRWNGAVEEEDSHVKPLGATAAIVKAIYHATGKRVRDLPATLDKLI